jgi:hypothetical protein
MLTDRVRDVGYRENPKAEGRNPKEIRNLKAK